MVWRLETMSETSNVLCMVVGRISAVLRIQEEIGTYSSYLRV